MTSHDFVLDDRLVFSLDPRTVYQYDLRTVTSTRRSKPRRISPLDRTRSSPGIVDGGLNTPSQAARALPADGSEPLTLRARLRPLLAQSLPNLTPSEPQMMRRRSSTVQALLDVAAANETGENPNYAAIRLANAPVQPSAALDEEDLKIAQLGLETGEDAVNYFTAATKDSRVKFVHLVPADTGMEFKPYTLDVVPSGIAVARGEYFTMSRSGLVHCVLRKGTNATECISMNEWVRHSTFFNLLRSISYFKYFIPFKMFRQWRSNVRQHLFAQQRQRLTARLFLARASFCQPMIELKREIFELKKASFIMTPRPRVQSDPLEVFMEQQIVTRKEAMAMCEAAMKRVVEIASKACETVQTLDKNKAESEDPRKRLDALMAAKLEGKNVKARSMNAAVEERRARKRLAARAAEDRGLLSDFVRLADCMMVETVVAHVLQSFNGELLADFMDTQHKVGLFEVMVGFDETGTIFTPTLDDFFGMSHRIADEIIALVSRIPRVLDARGCAEHCTSAAFASKFDEVIRSLPLFDRFMDSLHDKFRDDFGQAMHNSTAFDPIRPVYEESKAFDPDEYRAVTRSFTESRKEFEQVCVWQKELDKMRTRESIGTIEVTSRQLKQTLSPFIEAKQDLLKGIIRDEARVQCAEVLKTLTRRVKILEATPQNLKEYATYVEQTAEYDEREMRRIKGPVDQMYALLQMNDVKIPPDDLVALDEMHSYATQYSEQLMAAKTLKEGELTAQSEQLDKDIVTLNSNLSEFTSAIMAGNFIDVAHFEDPEIPVVRKDLAMMHHRLEQLTSLARTYAGYKELFGYHADEFPQLKKATDQLKLVDKLWASVADWHAQHDSWILGDLTKLNAEEVDQKMQLFAADIFSLNRKINSPVTEKLMEVVEVFKPTMPLVMDLGNPAMLPRHWERLFKAMGKSYDPSKSFNLDDFIKWGIADHAELVSEIGGTASGESQLEKALVKMEVAWETLAFNTKEWRTSYILVGIDEIQQELDDQIVRTQAMRGSRFVKPFLKRTTAWESMLIELQDIIDNWLKVQAAWLYLEPIFSSDDIMKQIPTEGRLFKNVNQVWMDSMATTVAEPGVLQVARRSGLRESLVDANARLDRIQKGLNDYLETKRLAFPRFFFLSNDELLEILAETKDPTRVQPHLKKCFDGIVNLEFTDKLDILSCFDGPAGKGERLEFAYGPCHHRPINPRDSGGNVEKWLVEVESIMKKSLAFHIDEAVVDFAQTQRPQWLKNWQGQTVLTVNQIMWVTSVEDAINTGGGAMEALFDQRRDELLDVVKSVRGDIPKMLRKTLGSLVVMDVHNRDITAELAGADITAVTDFDWQAHLRYYHEAGGASAQCGEPGSIACRMINAMILYAYEYIGNCGRLVITPLTDRCYRTLMGAIHLNLGGAPEGPAGTGKTETTKDLGKAIAIQCVVTNCSDGLDYKAMGKFFKGLAASGAWACFDEFNRIQLEVLSVIAQQVLTIQQAKARGAERFLFEGTDLPLKMTCCPFITMNPGYAGRAELPDNLKVLFRTVAMMVPDYAMIGEILLYSMGYTDAKAMAVKIVTTYKLCSEQLSSQSHYDYGMRAVMAVLRAAGNLKRAEGDLPEDVLVLRSIIDVNLPKFLSPDVPLFEGITSDLYPGVKMPVPDREAMRGAFESSCKDRNLQPTPYFWDKVVQIYDMMVVRHGFMIVGMPFSGKTSAWKVLADSLGELHSKYPDDSRWTNVVPFIMNPKSVTMGQLYGQFDPVSTEWTDGVLAINYRNAATSKVGGVDDRKWVLLDGPVDAIWIENMNTVLDDNKKLCLMSGEIIAMSDVMSMIFEPMDLLVASPATVSRCGMVYMEPEQLGWQPILDSWLKMWKAVKVPSKPTEGGEAGQGSGSEATATLEEPARGEECHTDDFALSDEEVERLRVLFHWLVEPCMCLVRRSLKEVSPTVDSGLLKSLLNLLTCFLRDSIPNSKADLEAPRMKLIECGFLFALTWSVGVTVGGGGRARFSEFLRALIKDVACLEQAPYGGVQTLLAMRKWTPPPKMGLRFELNIPEEGEIYDYCFRPQDNGRWLSWLETLDGDFTIAPKTPFSEILVPTVCTAQISFLLPTMLPRGYRPLIVGPTGTGKSVCAAKCLAKELSPDKFKPLSLGFSAKTSANMTQEIIDGQLSKRRKGVFGPPIGKQAIIMIDDLNMPEVETYGAQPPIELLRQLVDSGGYYDLKEKSWVKVVDTVMMCAMGPPGGGRNPTTPRFLGHFGCLSFNEFDDDTLTLIFRTIVDHTIDDQFPGDVRNARNCVVEATLKTYREAMLNLLPTPSKSHYTFNLRDFSRVISGVLLCEPKDVVDRSTLARLWTHEALRVFADRLTDEADRNWFVAHARRMVNEVFELDFEDEFGHLRAEACHNSAVGYGELRRLFFGNYMAHPDEEFRPYAEVRDIPALQFTIEQYLVDFNAVSRKPMDLVMFMFAIEHVSRISRVLKMPGGNALLVGVGGSGRQSVSILATEVAGYKLNRIEISKNYSMVDWREDMKALLRDAGTGEKPVVFLFSDTQIKLEAFVEDINNILNSGEVPNLFANDEKVAICEKVRTFAKEVFGNKEAGRMTPLQLYSYFVSRVRQRLHIILAFSPIGDAFRDRLRLFPSLINCCFPPDHELLTNHGFKSLADVVDWRDDDGELLFASYNSVSDQIVYESPVKIVINPPCEQELVEFTASADVHRWAAASDLSGFSHVSKHASKQEICSHSPPELKQDSAADVAEHVSAFGTGMFSILATGNHDMYAQLGSIEGDCEEFNGRVDDQYFHDDGFRKVKASDCVHADLLNFKSNAEAGREVPLESTLTRAISEQLSRLELREPLQIEAFFLFYGFWLGNGDLDLDRNDEPCAIVVKAKIHDKAWVESVIDRCQVEHAFLIEDEKTLVVSIVDLNWVDLFSAEYYLKRATREQVVLHGDAIKAQKDDSRKGSQSVPSLTSEPAQIHGPQPYPPWMSLSLFAGCPSGSHFPNELNTVLNDSSCSEPRPSLAETSDARLSSDTEKDGSPSTLNLAAAISNKKAMSVCLKPSSFEREGLSFQCSLEDYVNRKAFVRTDINDFAPSKSAASSGGMARFRRKKVHSSANTFFEGLSSHDQITGLEDVIGHEHPSILASRSPLASALSDQGMRPLRGPFRRPGRAHVQIWQAMEQPAREGRSTKGLFWWALHLNKKCARSIILGRQRADGPNEATRQPAILTSSIRLRDQLMHLMFHAGYSAHFLPRKAHCWYHGANLYQNPDETLETSSSCSCWEVRFFDGKQFQPMLRAGKDIRKVWYTGHTWCAQMPSGFVVVRRARRENGVVTKASLPSIQGNCAIDWFTAWPGDALVAVAKKFLSDVELEESIRPAITSTCQHFHDAVRALSARFQAKAGRINYVTPTSYLELILAFKAALGKRRLAVKKEKDRYQNGLEQLAAAEESVGGMQKELTDLQPVLRQSQKDTDALMSEIEDKLPGVRKEEETVGKEAAVAQKEADKVQKQVDEVQADLDEAIPALNDALKALDTIKPADIDEVRKLAKPPATVKLVAEAICVMLGEKPVKVPDPDDPTKKVWDFWPTSQKMLNDKGFIPKLKNYDKDNIPIKVMKEIRTKYKQDPAFTPENAKKASSAAAGLCKWCYAMDTYDRVAKVVGPKKEALELAQKSLAVTMAALNKKKASLQQTQDNLSALQAKLAQSKRKKEELAAQVDLCGKKLVRAKQLIGDLGGEKLKWTGFTRALGAAYENLTGDVLVSAGLMAYLGPFTSTYRDSQMQEWVAHCLAQSIPCSGTPTLAGTLGNPVQIRQWNIEGLPTDNFSIDNGIIIFNSRRWPLMIDPQGQANKWVRNMEKQNGVHVLKLTDDYMRTLENAINFGQPVLLENVGEELDPTLEPLLLKQVFKSGGLDMIRLGDSTVQYSDQFRFYMTTKLRNPHYLPETSVKVTLLNFMITPVGLSDQLLGVVVSQERADLEKRKNELVLEGASNARKLKDIEDQILEILSSEGNILEDEKAITTLGKSKVTSDEIKQKQAVAEKTEKEIDEVRSGYRSVAYDTQVLFFCISDLNNIEPTYSYSLPWFINLFVSSIQKSEPSNDIASRLRNLSIHFEYSLYKNVCRSLLEKDKLLFSFVLTIRKLASKRGGSFDSAEWLFLLTGGVALDNPHANPCPDWLLQKQWNEVCLLSELPAFSDLRDKFKIQRGSWQAIYDSVSPHEMPLPGQWDAKLKGLRRLCALRCIRPDKVVLAVQKFVIETMGEIFVRPPPFDLQACYDESVCTTPLVFVLSPGSDPMGAVLQAAQQLNRRVSPMSLGQGQGPLADKLIANSTKDGSWVVLQNCHLAPSFMSRLEQICESLKPDSTDKDFRLWCTTYPSPIFPVSVLQNGIKMTIEPPKGLRANLIGSYSNAPLSDANYLDTCNKPGPFRKLSYALCVFHALLQERRLFGPLGWNIAYGFNESDLLISMQQLAMFLDENEEVPFKALKYCIGECNYGGRVTDGKDRRTLNCILDRFFCDEVLETGANLSDSGIYRMPGASTHPEFLSVISDLPLVAEPEIFGFHENAMITKDTKETSDLFTAILLTEGGGEGGGEGTSTDDQILSTANDILHKLPDAFDMEAAQVKYPVTWSESMNTVLCQELAKFNNLTNLIKSSLRSVLKAVKGIVVMSSALEKLGESLIYGTIPILWKSKSYPSFKPLAGYVQDLLARLSFAGNWVHDKPPPTYWLSAFFFQHAFMTASKQNYARSKTIPIDAIGLQFEMLPKPKYSNPPSLGVYCYGLFFEGARWCHQTNLLAESEPKVLYSPAPLIWFQPKKSVDIDHPPGYKCPVYKTADRRGILATTGHSTNFILDILVPSAIPEAHWVQRGVAMLSQLDD